jgi:hypothetical protein
MQPTPPRHVIRLGDAWEQPQPAGVHVRLTRRFGRPSGIGPGDRVHLVVASAAVAADVSLNGAALPPIAADADGWEQDVTPLLRDRNELSITIPAGQLPDGLPTGSLPPASGAPCDAGLPEGVVSAKQARGRPPAAMGRVTIEIVAGT